jgi:hypothetical protein
VHEDAVTVFRGSAGAPRANAAALARLTTSVTAVLGVGGSGVTMAEEGQLHEVVRVTDVRQESARWPDYSATATDLGVAGVAGIPMRHADEIIGALNIYSSQPREWSHEDIAVAVVLADVATSYVLNASKLHDQEQLSEQLQKALESRVVIEQAKGITAQRKSIMIDHASLRTVAEAILAWDFRSERGGRPRRSGVSQRAPTLCPGLISVPRLVSNVLKMPRWV